MQQVENTLPERAVLQREAGQRIAAGNTDAVVSWVRQLAATEPASAGMLARLLHQAGACEALEQAVNAADIPGWPPGSGLLLRARQLEEQGEWQEADRVSALLGHADGQAGAPAIASPTPTTLMFRNVPLLEALVAAVAALLESRESLSIHVAASSSGAEAYSLAIALDAAGFGQRVRISASDVRQDLIESARAGWVDPADRDRFPADYARYLADHSGRKRICDSIRGAIEFSVRDLLAPSADSQQHDVVIANNVLVHYPDAQKTEMLRSLASCLAADGLLCAGGLRNDPLLPVVAVLGLHPVPARVRDIYEAWSIQRSAWYRLPRQYWTLPPWRPGPDSDALHAALFAASPSTASRLNDAIDSSVGWRFPRAGIPS